MSKQSNQRYRKEKEKEVTSSNSYKTSEPSDYYRRQHGENDSEDEFDNSFNEDTYDGYTLDDD